MPGGFLNAPEPLSIEIAVVDRVITNHVRTALAEPQPYLIAALGPRPETPAPTQQWDRAATAIETYRTGRLGLEPTVGPAEPTTANPIERAIGQRPPNTVATASWDHTKQLAASANPLLRPTISQGPDLSR